MKSIEYKGLWWLPENPNNKIAGWLNFSQPSKITLETVGSFETPYSGLNLKNYPVILGATDKGQLVTLYHCMTTRHNTSTIETSELLAHIIYEGVHLTKKQDFKFTQLQVNYSYLFDWVENSGLTRKYFKPQNKVTHSLEYLCLSDIEIETKFGKLKISFSASIKAGFDTHHIKESVCFFAENFGEKTFDELSNNLLFPLQSLISLGTTKPNFIDELFFFHSDKPVKIYYPQKFYQAKKKHLFDIDMLFMLRDISDDIKSIFEKWLEISQEIDNVLHLYFRVKPIPNTYLELRFLSIVQALESFHRQLRYKNEKHLKTRLEELFNETEEIMKPLVDNTDKFIELIRDTRNYYTHYDKRKKMKAAQGSKLFWLIEKLSIMLESCLLNELNINQSKQFKLFRRNEYYNQLTTKR